MQLLILFLLGAISNVGGVKFHTAGVTVEGGVLRVGEFASIGCKYIKWKQETINKVTWSMRYPGVKTNFFTYNYDNGYMDVPSSSFFTVDRSSSGEKDVRVRLNSGRESEMEICCEVEAIRDSGYGIIKKVDNEKCTTIQVMSGAPVSLRLNSNMNSVKVGDNIQVNCQSEHTPDNSALVILVNNEEHRGTISDRDQYVVTVAVRDDHFTDSSRSSSHRQDEDNLIVECLAKLGDQTLANSTLTIPRTRVVRPYTVTANIGHKYVEETRASNAQARNARMFWTERQSHVNHGNIPCHSYIVMQEGNFQGSQTGTLLLGELTQDIISYIRPVRTADRRFETEEDYVSVLNILGYNGYTVVGMTTNSQNRLTWTLERKYFEFHNDL